MGKTNPPAMANHSIVIIGDEAILYGGNTDNGENRKLYIFDLLAKSWTAAETKFKTYLDIERESQDTFNYY